MVNLELTYENIIEAIIASIRIQKGWDDALYGLHPDETFLISFCKHEVKKEARRIAKDIEVYKITRFLSGLDKAGYRVPEQLFDFVDMIINGPIADWVRSHKRVEVVAKDLDKIAIPYSTDSSIKNYSYTESMNMENLVRDYDIEFVDIKSLIFRNGKEVRIGYSEKTATILISSLK